jgi:hypothetical protein
MYFRAYMLLALVQCTKAEVATVKADAAKDIAQTASCVLGQAGNGNTSALSIATICGTEDALTIATQLAGGLEKPSPCGDAAAPAPSQGAIDLAEKLRAVH